MTSKQEKLDNISRLKSELKAAQEQFNQDYGFSESEIKIIDFLDKRGGKGATAATLSRHIRAFSRIGEDGKAFLLDRMVAEKKLVIKAVQSFSNRGRKNNSYFLVAADD